MFSPTKAKIKSKVRRRDLNPYAKFHYLLLMSLNNAVSSYELGFFMFLNLNCFYFYKLCSSSKLNT